MPHPTQPLKVIRRQSSLFAANHLTDTLANKTVQENTQTKYNSSNDVCCATGIRGLQPIAKATVDRVSKRMSLGGLAGGHCPPKKTNLMTDAMFFCANRVIFQCLYNSFLHTWPG